MLPLCGADDRAPLLSPSHAWHWVTEWWDPSVISISPPSSLFLFSLHVNSLCTMRGSLTCFAWVDHVPDSKDSGDKSRARPRPPLIKPSCVLPSLIQSAVVPRERGWCGPPPVKLITRGRLPLARWLGASSRSPLSVCGHPGCLRGRASG
jgi:hypothetical protein